MSRLHYGVHFPAGQQRSSNLMSYVNHVDALGYDSIWLIENLGSGSPGLECFTTLGYMAAAAPRLTIGTSVLLLPLRNPVIAAQAAATLQVLTDGKLILGIGVGGAEHHTALGSDARTRGRRCEEWLELMRKLWSEPEVSYEGTYINVRNYTLGPVAPRPPQVWVGGHSEASLKRAARHADGFIPVGSAPDNCAEIYSRLDGYAAGYEHERTLTRAVHAYVGFGRSSTEAMAVASDVVSERYQSEVSVRDPSPHLLGTPEDCRQTLEAFRAVGVTHFVFDPVCRGEETEEQIERLMKEVIEPSRGH